MAEKPAAERTEYPTPRRLEKARQKGQVAESEELASVVTLLALVAVMVLAGPSVLRWSITQVTEGMSCATDIFAGNKSFLDFIKGKITDSLLIICPILAALFAGSALGSVAVSGLNFAPEALSLKFDQINPVTGFERLVSGRSVVKLLASILKLVFVAVVVWSYLHSRLDTLAALRWAWSMQMLAVVAKMIMGLMIRIGIALLVIGIADAFYQKWKYIEELKMTRQEVRQERKDTEGAPEVKGRIRRVQFEMARKRMLQEVPKASVVLVNPAHIAVALRYKAETMEAPVLVAKGADHLAEKIMEIARAYGVPIVRRPELARTIYSTVEPGSPIPEVLYVAVAEVLAIIYRLRHRVVRGT
jgi:flagellar biosynthetic protein FlhB